MTADPSRAVEGGDPGVGLLDAHLHLWDPRRLPIEWLRDLPGIDRPILLDDYATAAQAAGVTSGIYVEVAVDDGGLEAELEWIVGLVETEGPVRAAVAGWRPSAETTTTVAWLDRLAATDGVVGVREVMHPPDVPSEAALHPRRIEACRAAGDRGLVVDLCARPDQLAAVASLLEAAPDTRFVLDHLGRPDTAGPLDSEWRSALAAVSNRPNVVVKCSALIECGGHATWTPEAFDPFVAAALALFGPDRMLWGSNWPVCMDTPSGLHRWAEASRRILAGLSPGDRQEVFGGTARRTYGLPTDG